MTPPFPSSPPRGWLVGEPPSRPPSAPGGPEQRSARLEARLDVYARYGALVAEEAAAVLRGDAARAEALAAERAALAEHYEELRAGEPAGPAPPFRETLADALLEADHQAAVDLALRRELTRVAEGLRALPAPNSAATPADDDGEAEPEPTVDGVVAALGGMLIDARAQGVGGALSGYFPGIAGGVGGAEVATLYGEDPGGAAEDRGSGAPTSPEGRRLDVRF